MKTTILFTTIVLLSCSIYADEQKETCRSYIVDLSVNKKYCLFDADEKIAEFDRQLKEKQHRQELDVLQKNDPGPFPEHPVEQTENK